MWTCWTLGEPRKASDWHKMLKYQPFPGVQGRRANPIASVSPASTAIGMGSGLCSPFSGASAEGRGCALVAPPSDDVSGPVSPQNTDLSYSCVSDVASPGAYSPMPSSTCPPHGAKAVCGRRTKMEDVYAIREDLLWAHDLALKPILPSQLDSRHRRPLTRPNSKGLSGCCDNGGGLGADAYPELLHFFAVFDGHGGVEASKHCAERMYRNLQEAWARRIDCPAMAVDARSDDVLVSSCGTCETNGSDACSWNSGRSTATSDDVREVFMDAFSKTDDEFNGADVSALVGSTAVVALVGSRHLLVANCGDSRAVLCRDGTAHPLTVDHKPEREDEMARVEKAGGQVWFWNGPRVMGVLAMSRAIGDRSLRPYVIPDPEVTIVPRTAEDSLLIMATDGLWDVVDDQEACTLAMKCLERARQKGTTDAEAARLTATVLIRAAMDRGSRDNITVVVVDLKNCENSTANAEYFTASQVSSSSLVSKAPIVDRQRTCQTGMDIEPIAAADEVVA